MEQTPSLKFIHVDAFESCGDYQIIYLQGIYGNRVYLGVIHKDDISLFYQKFENCCLIDNIKKMIKEVVDEKKRGWV